MKKIIVLLCLLSVSSNYANYFGGGGQPEFYFQITDVAGGYYRIKAVKSDNEPIYDHDFNYTHALDLVYERVDEQGNHVSFEVGPPPAVQNKDFDWTADANAGQGGRGIIWAI